MHRALLRSCVVVAGLCVVGVSSGCSRGDDRTAGPYFGTELFANAVVPLTGRAEGQHYFLYETWGAETRNTWPPAWFLLELMEDEPGVFGSQFAAFGTIPDPRDDLPFGLKRGAEDPERVHQTCALCHVGYLPDGRLWLGAPNTNLDLGRLKVEVNQRWVEAGYPSLLTPLEEEKLGALGPGRFDASSAGYPRAIPADFPPYFNLGEKTALNYLGATGDLRSEIAMALYVFGAGAPPPEGKAAIPFPSAEKRQALEDFLGGIEPPERLSGERPELIARGEEIFEEEGCGRCHFPDDVAKNGVVTHVEGGPELLPGEDPSFDRGAISTSVALRVLMDGDDDPADPIAADDEERPADAGRLGLVGFILLNGLQVGTTDGYRAPDLGGVWATAPYLHNGSVPTLEDLLRPAEERPLRFNRGSFVVDTETWGNGNGGHEFGTELSGADREALVEYLKSL